MLASYAFAYNKDFNGTIYACTFISLTKDEIQKSIAIIWSAYIDCIIEDSLVST